MKKALLFLICAARKRGAICENAAKQWPVGASWLRRMHRSHAPGARAFSVCVHRADAATVRYTEEQVDAKRIAMGYVTGNFCQREEFDSQVTLPLVRQRSSALAS